MDVINEMKIWKHVNNSWYISADIWWNLQAAVIWVIIFKDLKFLMFELFDCYSLTLMVRPLLHYLNCREDIDLN